MTKDAVLCWVTIGGSRLISLKKKKLFQIPYSQMVKLIAKTQTSYYTSGREFSIRNHLCLSSITPWNGCVKQVLADNPIQCYQELFILFWTNFSLVLLSYKTWAELWHPPYPWKRRHTYVVKPVDGYCYSSLPCPNGEVPFLHRHVDGTLNSTLPL